MTSRQSTDIVAPTQVLERVRALVPELRARAAETERHGKPLPAIIDALTEAGVFRLTIPAMYGGAEASADDVCVVLHEIARGCPSTAWVCSLFTACTWWGALFDDEAVEEIFAEPDVRVAAIIAPTGSGKRVEGGVVVNGRWAFNTGCFYSHWTGNAVMIEGDDGIIAPWVAMMATSELEILDDWHSFGMAGTGSNTTVARDVFVPERRLLPVSALLTADYPSTLSRQNPYFRVPAVPAFTALSSGVLVGIARGAMDVFLERLPGRSITYTDWTDQSQAPLTHQQVGSAELKIESAMGFATMANGLVAKYAGEEFPVAERVRVKAYTAECGRLAREATQILFEASGASAIQLSVPIQRHLRDIEALAIHGMLQPTTMTELYGRVLLGLEPNTLFL